MSAQPLATTTRDKAKAPETVSSGSSAPSTGAVQMKQQLRGMSYEDGAKFLAPPAGDAPVQARGGDAAGDVHQAAAHGIAGGGGSLPHLESIQQSFGGHDVSGISAHVGGKATEASKAMGAEAYATGNSVAFGEAPSLHTAAHEAAHIVQQRAGVSLSGGVGSVGDRYENHADAVADKVVKGESASGLLNEMSGGAKSGGAVQQRVVQREETGSSETDTTTTTDTTPVFSGPESYGAYSAHINNVFAPELAEMAGMTAEFVGKGGDVQRAEQTLQPNFLELDRLKEQYATTVDDLDAQKKRKLEYQLATEQGVADNAGSTMPMLLDMAKHLASEIEKKGKAAVAEKQQLEGVMQSAMRLGSQIDPEGLGVGRSLYNRIDKAENPKLVREAGEAGKDRAQQAQLAVNCRNWLRTFMRDEVMEDRNQVEVLYLRDLGKTGSREGMSLELVMKKVIRNLQAKPETGEAVLAGDFRLDTATPEELDAIYTGVIGSAKQTNAGVNSSAQGGAPKT
ncbi:MAG: hypothetical protein ACI9MR_003634 [Myxococcota bacterium]|jgi:hypothetical protein